MITQMTRIYFYQLVIILLIYFISTNSALEKAINSVGSNNRTKLNQKQSENKTNVEISQTSKFNISKNDKSGNQKIALIKLMQNNSNTEKRFGISNISSVPIARIVETSFVIYSDETLNKTNNLENYDNSTSNSTSLTTQSTPFVNDTEITTSRAEVNITTDSLMPITEVTPVRQTTQTKSIGDNKFRITKQDINDSYPPISENNTNSYVTSITETPNTETESLITSAMSTTEPTIDVSTSSVTTTIKPISKSGRSRVWSVCKLDPNIECRYKESIHCYGYGFIDCGFNNQRIPRDDDYFVDPSMRQPFKLALEKDSQSDSIINNKCVLSDYVDCNLNAEQLKKLCTGKGNCEPLNESDEQKQMEWWKIGIIATLTAAGATIFIIVAVVAYISWNKLKVRPELAMNGYHNNPQHNTRV